jgi:hypothetical protein
MRAGRRVTNNRVEIEPISPISEQRQRRAFRFQPLKEAATGCHMTPMGRPAAIRDVFAVRPIAPASLDWHALRNCRRRLACHEGRGIRRRRVDLRVGGGAMSSPRRSMGIVRLPSRAPSSTCMRTPLIAPRWTRARGRSCRHRQRDRRRATATIPRPRRRAGR